MNRKNAGNFLSFAFLIVIICSALLPVFSLQNNASILSHGTVDYPEPPPPPSPAPSPSPSPSPTPTPSTYIGTNLAPLNEWHVPPPHWAPSYWEPLGYKGIAPAWRNEYAGTTKQREMNSDWIEVKPGDHIVFSAWMKMDPTSRNVDEVTPDMGCRIGLDWYTYTGPIKKPDNGYTEGVAYNPKGEEPTYPQQFSLLLLNYVPPGSDWTFRVIDLTVPSTVHGETPNGVILWWGLPHYVHGEQATAWLSETEFYINPT